MMEKFFILYLVFFFLFQKALSYNVWAHNRNYRGCINDYICSKRSIQNVQEICTNRKQTSNRYTEMIPMDTQDIYKTRLTTPVIIVTVTVI